MPTAKTEFLWHASLAFTNEYGEMNLVHAENTAVATGDFNESELERSAVASAVAWVAGEIDEDPERVEVVGFTWSSLDTTYEGAAQ